MKKSLTLQIRLADFVATAVFATAVLKQLNWDIDPKDCLSFGCESIYNQSRTWTCPNQNCTATSCKTHIFWAIRKAFLDLPKQQRKNVYTMDAISVNCLNNCKIDENKIVVRNLSFKESHDDLYKKFMSLIFVHEENQRLIDLAAERIENRMIDRE